MSGLADLIERLEKLDGPEAFLDEAIWEAIGDWPSTEYRSCNYMKAFGTPLTGSLDAATALVERVLPGWACGFDSGQKTHIAFVDPYDYADRLFGARYTAEASTPAIALCLALLRALQQEEKR